MKRKLSFAVFAGAAAIFGFSLSAAADPARAGIVTADILNVRSLPTTESVILSQLPNGSTVYVTETLDNWYKIDLGEYEAYVCADYVVFGDAPEPAPVSSPDEIYQLPPDVPSYEGSQLAGEILAETAKTFIGTPYVYGGMSPDGFDCSGFVKYCYSLMNVDIKRVASDQATCGVEVPPDAMQPGDILCFASSVGGDYIGHTGIYVGNGYFIHSPHTGSSVEVVPLSGSSYADRLTYVRRIF